MIARNCRHCLAPCLRELGRSNTDLLVSVGGLHAGQKLVTVLKQCASALVVHALKLLMTGGWVSCPPATPIVLGGPGDFIERQEVWGRSADELLILLPVEH